MDGAIPTELGRLTAVTYLYAARRPISTVAPTSTQISRGGPVMPVCAAVCAPRSDSRALPSVGLIGIRAARCRVFSSNTLAGAIPNELAQLTELVLWYAARLPG